MPELLRIELRGPPVAQPRGWEATKKDALGRTRRFRFVKRKHPVHAYRGGLRLAAKAALGPRPPSAAALRLTVVFVFARPKDWKEAGPAWRPGTPDLDNLEKAVKDALKGVVYLNDSQVVDVRKQKRYAARGEAAATLVLVETTAEPVRCRPEELIPGRPAGRPLLEVLDDLHDSPPAPAPGHGAESRPANPPVGPGDAGGDGPADGPA